MDTRLRMVVAAAMAVASAFAMGGSRLVAQDAPAELTGCHDLIVGQWVVETHADWENPSPLDSDRWYRIPRIRFAGPHDRRPTATRIVAAGGESLEALGYEDRFATGEIEGDSLLLVFSDGFTGMTATMGRAGEGWSGTVRTFTDIVPHQVNDRPVAMSRVDCESPLPVPGDDSRPLGRVVELEGGHVITVESRFPSSWRRRRFRGSAGSRERMARKRRHRAAPSAWSAEPVDSSVPRTSSRSTPISTAPCIPSGSCTAPPVPWRPWRSGFAVAAARRAPGRGLRGCTSTGVRPPPCGCDLRRPPRPRCS